MAIKKTKLISGFEIIDDKYKGKTDKVEKQVIDFKDIELTCRVKSKGGYLNDDVENVINLYHRYYNPNTYICPTCSNDVGNAWLNYLNIYNNWLEKPENIDRLNYKVKIEGIIIEEKQNK